MRFEIKCLKCEPATLRLIWKVIVMFGDLD
ncbi:hypothetical protein OH687_10135 [Burkholderia anthina]|nr:hypothetical protein OH687_10135 [Burkholderia anthina]